MLFNIYILIILKKKCLIVVFLFQLVLYMIMLPILCLIIRFLILNDSHFEKNIEGIL